MDKRTRIRKSLAGGNKKLLGDQLSYSRELAEKFRIRWRGNELYLFVKLWHSYLDFFLQVVEDPVDKTEWSTLNACIGNLPSGSLRLAFFSPERLSKFIECIISVKKEDAVPNIPRMFFSRPALVYKQMDAESGASRTPLDSGFEYLNALETYVFGRGRGAANDIWKSYCEVMKHAAIYYSRGLVRITYNLVSHTPEILRDYSIRHPPLCGVRWAFPFGTKGPWDSPAVPKWTQSAHLPPSRLYCSKRGRKSPSECIERDFGMLKVVKMCDKMANIQ
ncbi:hypothetical protein SCHPADRAFT_895762 [Schizopora paradoxa]|uniref:Uncharacterized protein n=1 Tax=Schizopora paradoxa TaxID=27342 RepID=A0A0H2R9B2_9AGAM|nr:hypothetical protein SCHPADRAFT_895762 [Schizopora paradoxa]